MTGVLPIAKYSDGSELNMFLEYNMATRIRFSEYFGFSDEEVDMIYKRYLKIQNRRLVVKILENGMMVIIRLRGNGCIIHVRLYVH